VTPLEEAKHLLLVAGEDTQYRTAGSRAYFATFNRLKMFAAGAGFVPTKAATDHNKLSTFLTANSSPLLRRMGVRLGNMRTLRNRADYEVTSVFKKGWAQDLVDDAEQVEQWVAAVTATASGSAPSSKTTP
jgi:uncharacterized protein (UPF0332 family)